MLSEPQGVADAVELAGSENPSTIILILGMFLAAVRLAEAVVSKYITRPDGGHAWTKEDQDRLKVLHELHARYGADGTPVWYSNEDPAVAVRMAADLRKLAESQQGIAEAQRDTLRILERLDDRVSGNHG